MIMMMSRETSNIMTRLVTAGTTPAATMDAFYDLLLPEMLGDPADTSSCKVVVTCLYATKATKMLITWLQRGSFLF
jgi:hypothetical protein